MNSSSGQFEEPNDDRREYASRPEDAVSSERSGSSPHLLDLDLPASELDLTTTFESIMSEPASRPDTGMNTVQKRASNVLKLTQEHAKLQAELKAMTERLEAAERRQRELAERAAAKERRIPTS